MVNALSAGVVRNTPAKALASVQSAVADAPQTADSAYWDQLDAVNASANSPLPGSETGHAPTASLPVPIMGF